MLLTPNMILSTPREKILKTQSISKAEIFWTTKHKKIFRKLSEDPAELQRKETIHKFTTNAHTFHQLRKDTILGNLR
jgi:hypothetical protein